MDPLSPTTNRQQLLKEPPDNKTLKPNLISPFMNHRIVFLDYLRVIACLMVIIVHCVEPFYLGGDGTLIKNWSDACWVTIIDSPLRAAVPLFVMASSYLQFPIKYDTRTFFKKRILRVGIPFLVFSLLYAIIPLWGSNGGSLWDNLQRLPFNFVNTAGHLWFVYMLLGVYLIMPLLSPWIQSISKREEQIFLLVWAFTTTLPFIRTAAQATFGLPEVWGEANWNEFGTFYYISGFIGYVVLGHYFRTYVPAFSWRKTLSLAAPLWAVGYLITAGGFWSVMPKEFPVSDSIELAVQMETSWRFCTTGVMLTTLAYFLLFRKLTYEGWAYQKWILPISKFSYGIYLMHIFILVPTLSLVQTWNLGTPVTILMAALLTFLLCAFLCKLLSFIPGSRWVIG